MLQSTLSRFGLPNLKCRRQVCGASTFFTPFIRRHLHTDGFHDTSRCWAHGAKHSTVSHMDSRIYNCHELAFGAQIIVIVRSPCVDFTKIGPRKPLASLYQTSTPYNPRSSTSRAFRHSRFRDVEDLDQFYAVKIALLWKVCARLLMLYVYLLFPSPTFMRCSKSNFCQNWLKTKRLIKCQP
jgi:hypothetical protein